MARAPIAPSPALRLSRLAAPLAAAAVGVFVVVGPSAFAGFDPSVVGDAILDGRMPYRDFPFEYPPGGALAFALPALAPAGTYRVLFRALMALAWGVLALLVARERPAGIPSFMLASIAYSFVIDTMFDTVVALALFAAWRSAVRDRAPASAGWIAAGTLLKLVPAAAAGLTLRAGRRGRTAAAGIVLGSIALATVLPAVLSRDGGDVVGFQRARLIHAESTAGSAVLAARAARNRPSGVVFEHRAQGVAAAPGWAKPGSYAAMGAMLVLLVFRADPRAPDAWAALALAVPALGPIASPQFLVWPLGFAAAMDRRALVAYVIAGAISFAYFMVPDLRTTGTVLPAFTILARNCALVAAAGLAAVAAIRGPAPEQG